MTSHRLCLHSNARMSRAPQFPLVTLLLMTCIAAPAEAAPPQGSPPKQAARAQGLLRPDDVDVADVVRSAMKTPTTVQEAPAIITVLTEDQLRNQGFRRLGEAIGMSVPGFLPFDYAFGLISTALTRGILFGTLILHDGLDMYDPIGFPLLTESLPLNSIQRVEVVSGPGGVLWGANSFVGVLNIVSKTADDLQGVEASLGYGLGVHRKNQLEASATGGIKLLGGKLKLLLNASYQGWHENNRKVLFLPLGGALGAGASTYGPGFDSEGGTSHSLTFSGNAEYGPLSLHWRVPWSYLAPSMTQSGAGIRPALGEDQLDCRLPQNAAACALRVDPDRLARDTIYRYHPRIAIARYRQRLLGDRIGVDARAFFAQYVLEYTPLFFAAPSEILPGGLGLHMDYTTYRGGFSLDSDITLPWSSRLLIGGEVFYDYLPERRGRVRASEQGLASAPLQCPPASGDNPCPVLIANESNRLTAGLFISGQTRILDQLALSAGTRLQVYGGKRALDPVFMVEGAAVWSFLQNANLKLSFSEGFRPPSLLKTDGGVSFWDGNPNLNIERSRSVQAEINGRLLVDRMAIRQLAVRADYSYTWVKDFIVVNNNQFQNRSNLGIHSIELLARLQLKRGHNLSLGYTFNDVAADDVGRLRSIPGQWLTLQGVFQLIKDRLLFSTNLAVVGPFEDPNQRPHRAVGGMHLGSLGADGQPIQDPLVVATWSDRVLDRVGPAAIWNAGLRLALPALKLTLSTDVYNILDVRSYNPEGFMDLSAGFETLPSPWRGISFMNTARFAL